MIGSVLPAEIGAADSHRLDAVAERFGEAPDVLDRKLGLIAEHRMDVVLTSDEGDVPLFGVPDALRSPKADGRDHHRIPIAPDTRDRPKTP